MTERKLPTFTIGCKCGEVLAYDGKELQCPKCYRKYDSLGRLKEDHAPGRKQPQATR